MKTNSVNFCSKTDNYKQKRRMRDFRTGAVIGAGLGSARTIFASEGLRNLYNHTAKNESNFAAFRKTAGMAGGWILGGALVYGLLNIALGAIVDKLVKVVNRDA